MTIREILNQIFWDKRKNPKEYELTFIHRGACYDKKTIPCYFITKIKASWFTYIFEEKETLIPFHRILELKNIKTRRIIWKKKIPGQQY